MDHECPNQIHTDRLHQPQALPFRSKTTIKLLKNPPSKKLLLLLLHVNITTTHDSLGRTDQNFWNVSIWHCSSALSQSACSSAPAVPLTPTQLCHYTNTAQKLCVTARKREGGGDPSLEFTKKQTEETIWMEGRKRAHSREGRRVEMGGGLESSWLRMRETMRAMWPPLSPCYNPPTHTNRGTP